MPDDRPDIPDSNPSSVDLDEAGPVNIDAAKGGRSSLLASWQLPAIVLSVGAIAAAIVFHGRSPEPEVDPGVELREARVAFERGDLAETGRRLGVVEAMLGRHPDLLGNYHLLVADHRARSASPLESAPSDLAEQVVQAYERALADGAELDPERRLQLAFARKSMGRTEEALVGLDEAQDWLEGLDDRVRLRRVRTITQGLRQGQVMAMVEAGEPPARIRGELARLMDGSLGVEMEAWAVGLDARLRLEAGDVDGLARTLLFQMRRIEGMEAAADDPMVSVDWASLWVLLGHAHREEHLLPGRAMECYETAIERLEATGTTRAEALMSLADLEITAARQAMVPEELGRAIDAARGHYEGVALVPEATVEQQASALVGLAIASMLERDHESTGASLEIVGGILESQGRAVGDTRYEAVLAALEAAQVAMDEGQSSDGVEAIALCDTTVGYGEFVVRHAVDPVIRRQGLEFVANARERSAMHVLTPHLGDDDPRLDRTVEMVPVEIRLEAARRFAAAATAIDEIERDMAGDDPDRFRFIWRAATLHDKAGASGLALSRYVRFVESQSAEAGLWPEAVYRIAAAHHAVRSLPEAEAWYRKLLKDMEGGLDEVSEFTTRAKVGLSRVLMERAGESAIPEAEALLNGVLSGTARDAVEPSVPEYRDALLQLIRLLEGESRWSEVAGRGDEWLDRYEDDPRWGEVAVRTGRAFLRHGDVLEAANTDAALNPSIGAIREAERVRSLSRASARLGQAVARLGGRSVDGLDPYEAKLLRAAYIDRAVVSDRRGDLAEAIRLHRDTERRFAGEPVAVVALVMMADAAERAGDRATAAAATDRARKRLQHLHREGGGSGFGIEDLGPEMMFGPGDEVLARWITAFPPGVGIAVGAEDGP